MNLNDKIQVTLTETGVKYYKNFIDNLDVTINWYPGLKDNVLTIQLWEFAHIFGRELWHGNPYHPCEMEFQLVN